MGKQVFVEESAGNSTHNDMLGLASATLEQQNPTGTCDTPRWASKDRSPSHRDSRRRALRPNAQTPETTEPEIVRPYTASHQVQDKANSDKAPNC